MGLFTSTFTHTHTTTLVAPSSSQSESSPPRQPSPKSTYRAALSLLHDPAAIITLNPLVTHFEEVKPSSADVKNLLPQPHNPISRDTPDQPLEHRQYFRITDAKSLFFGWYTTKICYYISYLKVDGGCDTVVAAPGAVSIEGSWRVYEDTAAAAAAAGDGKGEIRLTEKATVHCPSVFAMFIKGTLGSSHDVMHQRFVQKLEG